MKTIEIHTIEFETGIEASENKNYPNSGLFITRIKGGMSDLRFVDKSISNNYCIVPESVFNGVFNTKEVTELPLMQEIESVNQKFDGDFILEFSRILLNRK